MKIKINTHGLPPPKKAQGGDWIDLAASETVTLKAGEIKNIPLGISMEIPRNCTAYVLPRNSTPKRNGIILANGMGVIDRDYNGDGDIWGFPAYAIRDTTIHKGDRIAQFAVYRKPLRFAWKQVELLGNKNRGGFGSTGGEMMDINVQDNAGMTTQEAIETIRCAIAEVEWDYTLDYAVAFEMAIEALEKPKINQWVSVKERLPEKNQDTLVCYRFDFGDGTSSAEYINVMLYHAVRQNPYWQLEGFGGLRVTHWMPLPEPPET